MEVRAQRVAPPATDPFGEQRPPLHRRLRGRARPRLTRAEQRVCVAAAALGWVDGIAQHGVAGRATGLVLVVGVPWWCERRARGRRRREQETILPGAEA